MATTLIHNGAVAGAMAATVANRSQHSSNPADYAAMANVAAAFATQFLTANAALAVPMADADNASIEYLVAAVCLGIMTGRTMSSTTATDYLNEAQVAAAAAKEAVAKLT